MLMFNQESFAVFNSGNLDERMAEIRSKIQPIFQELNAYFTEELEKELRDDLFIHIAQHRRRTVHPPESTWSAISRQRRGYKMETHFQLGIWPSHVFMWQSINDPSKTKNELAEKILAHRDLFEKLAEDTVINQDHIIEDYTPLSGTFDSAVIHFNNVKKSEFQVGRVITATSSLWDEPEQARSYMIETYRSLSKLYSSFSNIALSKI